jgi:hypothetical protein
MIHRSAITVKGLFRHIPALVLIVSSLAGAQSNCQFTLARLKYGGGGDWYANPSSLPNLVAAARTRTKLPLCDSIATIEIMDERLFHFPFIYMTGHGDVRFTNQERIRLRTYLAGGGFLWADDNYGLDISLRREIAALFPEHPLTELAADHPVYTRLYRLNGLPKIDEHDGKRAQGLGVMYEGRLVIFYSFSSDIGDGMEDLHVHGDGEELHELALRMGLNLLSWFFDP